MPISKKILLVEDEPILAQLIELELIDAGYDVEQVTNGLEAIEKLHLANIDIILSDLFMPEIGGIELIKYINQEKLQIPVIVFSASTQEEIKQELATLGIIHFIEKPFDDAKFEHMLNIIRSI